MLEFRRSQPRPARRTNTASCPTEFNLAAPFPAIVLQRQRLLMPGRHKSAEKDNHSALRSRFPFRTCSDGKIKPLDIRY
ncbi:unnamed protein product [Oikopleura dioica]|uniref:Uncharacterized protein n=1 Tax=Oikopleura dioica TaxID=34765 RepID=E4XEY6_OIKDI|nr:unnamed protein product [Oikopleura dioica]CBY40660.1 unnamed protein product [Oikopleura dioica]